MPGSWTGSVPVGRVIALILAAVTAAGVRGEEPPESQLEHATGMAIVDAIRNYPLLSGRQSLGRIEMADGFDVELVASEPLIRDPVAFDWGPDGRLWVAEMADYPFQREGGQRPGGRIQVLEDCDGDGVYDTATLFADGLSTPTGVLVWRGGLLVTACPDILYLEDTNGDGRADRIEKLYSGFTEGNQQHRVNGLVWGLDNWIYVANGDSGGQVVSHRTGESIDIRGRDLRIRPDSGQLEVQAGQTQFGRHRDDWGNWFSCNNPNPIFHFVLEEHYLRRNPYAVPPEIKRNILVGGTDVFPIGPIISHCDPIHRPLGASPHFTAACSTIVYRDELFGPDYDGATFTSEPVYNLVHARRLEPDGLSFRSHRLLPDGQEFFRSADPWSRPTMLQVGPDGALYIADMVREVIEHPEWIDPKLRTEIDVHSGDSFGRIYRVLPSGSRPRPVPDFSRLTSEQLVEQLLSPSGWQRDLVHRLLLWKADRSVVAQLEALVDSETDPRSRLQALAILDGLGALTADLLARVWDDPHPQLRRHAVRLSEPLLADDLNLTGRAGVEWEELYRRRLHDRSPLVRLQLAYSLGSTQASWGAGLLAELALQDQDDPIMVAAITSSLQPDNLPAMLQRLVAEPKAKAVLVGQLLAITCRMGVAEPMDGLIDTADDALITLDRMAAWFDAIGADRRQLESILGHDRRERLSVWLQSAARQLPESDVDRQAAWLRMSGHLTIAESDTIDRLAEHLAPSQPPQLQQMAVATLIEIATPDVPARLTEGWSQYGPQLRAQVLDALLTRPAWGNHLLQELEEGRITVGQLSAAHRDQLLRHPDPAFGQRIEQLLGRPTRQLDQVLLHYADAIPLALDGERDLDVGHRLFQQRCASCHRLDGVGGEVGPDLGSLANRSPPALLTAIVDPNRAIEARYLQYQVLTTDGQVLTGLLAEETTHSLRLVSADGKVIELLRSSVDQLHCTERSMMPEGLEDGLTVPQLADLIHYVMRPAGGAAQSSDTTAEPARP